MVAQTLTTAQRILASASRAYAADKGLVSEVLELRALGLIFRAIQDSEGSDIYAAAFDKFTPPEDLLTAWRGEYMRLHCNDFPDAVKLTRLAGGVVRNWAEGDRDEDTFHITRASCLALDSRAFGALPGRANEFATEKGRVAHLRALPKDAADSAFRRLVTVARVTTADGIKKGTRAANLDEWAVLDQTAERLLKSFKVSHGVEVAAYFSAEHAAMLDRVKVYAAKQAKADKL